MDSETKEHKKEDWVLLQDGVMKGMNIVVESTTGDVDSLSTRFCRDAERWNDEMPLLEGLASLRTLDLHNSRYLRTLHDSVGSLDALRCLILSRCDRLEHLPESLGRLKNLQEVRLY
jgi:hypothetical protein